MTRPVRLSQQELDHFYDQKLAEVAKIALSSHSVFWDGVQWFIDWLRYIVKEFIMTDLPAVSFVDTWATHVGVTVNQFLLSVLGTLTHLLRLVFCAPQIWEKAHESAKNAWDSNQDNGHLAQSYAYGRQIAAHFLELIKQCTEQAIEAHDLRVTGEDRQRISDAFDKLLYCQSFDSTLFDLLE